MRYTEYRKFQDACLAVAKGIAGTPLERSRAGFRSSPNKYLTNPLHNGRTPMQDYACIAKVYQTHPDAGVRALAEAQAADCHKLNDYIVHGEVHDGPCPGKACRKLRVNLPLSMFANNDHTMRIAMGKKRADRIKARGW